MNNENMVNTPSVEPVVEQPPVAPVTEPVTPVAPVAPQIDPNVVPTQAPQGENKPKSNKSTIIACIVILVLIAAGVGIYFAFFKKVSGRQVVNGTINKVFESAIKASEKIENNVVINYKEDIVKTNGTVKATLNTDDSDIKTALNNLNSVALDYDLRLDLKALNGSLDLTEKENGNEVITINSLLKDKNLYFKIGNIDEVYQLDMTDAFDWDSIDTSKLPEYKSKSLSAVLKKMQEYIKNAIKDEYITDEEGNFTVDGKDISGIKTTITLNSERANEISKSIVDQLINDDEGLTLFSEFTMTDKDDLKAQLESSKSASTNTNNDVTNEEKKQDVKINIYTTTRGKFLAMEATTGEDQTMSGIIAVSENDVTAIKFYSQGKETLRLDYNEKEKELIYKNNADNNKNETITIKFLEDGIKLTYSQDGGSISLEFTENIDSDKVSMNVNANLEYTESGKTTKAGLELSNTLSKADGLNEFNTTLAKNMEAMTEAEQQQFTTAVTNILSKSTLYKLIEAYAKNSDKQTQTTTNYNYTSPHCAAAYNCENYGGDYDYCKYNDDGYTYTVMCPHKN